MSQSEDGRGAAVAPATTESERRQRVDAMRANFAQEGMRPDVEHAALLERYIVGTATLSDLLDYARQYAATTQFRTRDDAVRAARANVALEGMQPSERVEECAARYVLGELGLDEFLEQNGEANASPGGIKAGIGD